MKGTESEQEPDLLESAGIGDEVFPGPFRKLICVPVWEREGTSSRQDPKSQTQQVFQGLNTNFVSLHKRPLHEPEESCCRKGLAGGIMKGSPERFFRPLFTCPEKSPPDPSLVVLCFGQGKRKNRNILFMPKVSGMRRQLIRPKQVSR